MQFGRYSLLQRLGFGGMAEVFRAREEGPRGFSRDVALKRILPEFADHPEFIDMLVAEARVSALLQHPVIVQVLDFGEVGGTYYLALELVEGCNLRELQAACREREHILPPGLACHIVAEVASALAYAHARTDGDGRSLRIVHRDVSPSNIMLSRAGAVKLLDFGIAKAANFLRDEQTRTGVMKGKLSYMSPEQAATRALDGRSDIFSLGAVFYEMLVSGRLFKGESDRATLDLVRRAQIRPPSELVPELDGELDAVVMKMLAVNPADRFRDCNELQAALAPLVRRLGGGPSELQAFIASVVLPAAEQTATASVGPSELPTDEVKTLAAHHLAHHLAHPAAVDLPPPRRRLSVTTLALGSASAAALAIGLAIFMAPATPSAPALGERKDDRADAAPVPASAEVAPPAVGTGQATAAPPPVPRVHLELLGTDGAVAAIDGKVVGTIPLDIDLPRASGTRLLVVEHPGFRRYSHQIAAGFDVMLRVELSPERKSHEPQ
jgi:serine/threonine-protein kinase